MKWIWIEIRLFLDGTRYDDPSYADETDAFNTFFAETAGGKHVPRCLFVDLEPTVVGTLIRNREY